MQSQNPATSVHQNELSEPAASDRLMRVDGQESRKRLLVAALPLFAQQGYAKTSIREIALAAQTNVAAISYYFGDKQGLYRAIFEDPHLNPGVDPASLNMAALDIRAVVDLLLRGLVEPLKAGEQARHCMKLHFREMIEPTGMWQAEIDNNIKPGHLALVQALCRHYGLAQEDDDIHRLAFEIAGMGIMLHVGHDVIDAIRPNLIASAQSLDTYHARLMDYAMVLIEHESQRRAKGKPI
jgi:TetR/AcrR family transcriptional regulator, regulator of cefoperazone and chloramphenicol sensitivity